MIEIASRLPAEYQEVEYIQSSGTQYIDTGFNPNQDTRTVMTCEIVSGSVCYVFGTWLEHPQSMYSVYWVNYWGVDYASSRTEYTGETSKKVTIDMNKNVITVGNTTKTVTKTTFTAPAPLTLFALNNSSNANPGQPDYFAIAKLYQCKMYDNGTLIRDFVPCYRKSNRVGGLYDIVNGVFYGNAGTGAFTFGNDVISEIAITPGGVIPQKYALRRRMMRVIETARLPKEYQEVEYIQSTGTQYIDTGYVVNASDTISWEFIAMVPAQSDAYMGANGYLQFHVTSSGVGISTFNASGLGSKKTFRIDFSNSVTKLYIDNVLVETKDWAGSYNGTNVKLGIFRLGDSGNTWNASISPVSCTLYEYSIKVGGNTVLHCVPCYRKSDNVAGVYDLVNDVFHGNAGTGAFIAGPEGGSL